MSSALGRFFLSQVRGGSLDGLDSVSAEEMALVSAVPAAAAAVPGRRLVALLGPKGKVRPLHYLHILAVGVIFSRSLIRVNLYFFEYCA